MEGIAGGENEWLRVAAALRPGTDAGATMSLNIVLGEVLARNPDGVLALLGDSFSTSDICVANVITDSLRYRTKALVLTELDRRISSVSSVKAPALDAKRRSCLGELRKDREFVANKDWNETSLEILCDSGYAVYEIVFYGRGGRCRKDQLGSKLFRLDIRERIARFKKELARFRARTKHLGESVDAMSHRLRVEQAMVTLIETPGIEKLAADYIKEATLFHEWEGMSQGPLDEARYAEEYLGEHPKTPLAPFLHLFIAHRSRAGFECLVFEGKENGQKHAEESYYRHLADAHRSSDPLITLLADTMDALPFVYMSKGKR